MQSNSFKPYVALIGGPWGVGSKITGSIPREFSADEKAQLQSTLAAGRTIQVTCASREAWVAMRENLMRQLEFGA